MTQVDFVNGATVSRIYPSTNEAELIASFQYITNARDFVKLLIAAELTSIFVVSDHSNGRVEVFQAPTPPNKWEHKKK